MDRTLTSFVRALRNADVRVSTAETLDAFHAVELVGYEDRTLLKNALAVTLPKTADEKAAFDTCFDQFFSFRDRSALPPRTTSAEDHAVADAPAGADGQGAGGEGAHDATRSDATSTDAADGTSSRRPEQRNSSAAEMSQAQSALGQLLMRGNRVEIDIAIAVAGEQVKIHEIEVFTQKGVYTRRILDAMGMAELQQEIERLGAGAGIADRRLAQELARGRDWLRETVRDYVERQFLLHADVTGKRLREDLLRGVKLASVDARQQRMLQDIVLRMARRLVNAYARRKKVVRRGRLHVPRTIRRNMKYDDAIFDLHWQSTKASRPKVFAVCDVSGSVASYAQFMLMFLYSLEEVLPNVRSFAFSSDLGEVSDLFARNKIADALALTLKLYSGSSNYGQALADFRELCLEDIDRRTTVVILGDARNNYGDARTDVLKELYERCRLLIWLNPEPRSLWNTGDSEMRHYAVYCHQVDECSTLAHLERFVSKLLRSNAR
jgi:uncharacterized protein